MLEDGEGWFWITQTFINNLKNKAIRGFKMEIKVLEETKNKIKMEIIGASHSLCNLLKKELWKDTDVKAAAYTIEHPVVGIPILIVETAGKNPRDVILDAVKGLKKDTDKFKKALQKGIK